MKNLSEIMPISYPLGLAIDPSNLCNFECKFCPTGFREDIRGQRENGMMSLELFSKIINDLKEWGVTIDNLKLWKDGEPFANKNIIEMIKISRASNVFKKITITTNGALLDRYAEELMKYPPDKIIISILSMNPKDYIPHSRSEKNYFKVLANIKKIFTEKERLKVKLEISPKICTFPGIKNEDLDNFEKTFKNISDNRIIIHEPFNWDDNHQNDLTLGYEKKRGNELKVCPYTFYTLNINFNGKVSICCVDWSHNVVVGDVKKQTVKEIWFGDKLKELKNNWRTGEIKKHKICGKCNFYKNLPEYSNIDDYVLNTNKKL